MQLRAKTLSELRTKLDESYFTAESFIINNIPNGHPFLEVKFSPSAKFSFKVYDLGNEKIATEESPGELVATSEARNYEDLQTALRAVTPWTRRIREEYAHAASIRNEVDEFLERFRANVFGASDDEDPSAEFNQDEITSLKSSLDSLKNLIAEQAEKLNATSFQLSEFEKEIERIKADLSGMPRGVWKKVASNKILKSVKSFVGSPEGRALIADGLKKMIGMS